MKVQDLFSSIRIELIRKKLKGYPKLYTFLRNGHVVIDSIRYFPYRFKLGYQYRTKLSSLSNDRKIWYLCVPIHNNLGDYAQYVCISKWIRECFQDWNVIEIPTIPLRFDYWNVFSILKKIVNTEDIIVFQSGYTSTDLHEDEYVHRKVVKCFVNNKIIFLPQTVKYSSEEQGKKTALIYNHHHHLLFIARDVVSYKTALNFFVNVRIKLLPDIVTTLIGSNSFNSIKRGIFFCLRHDSEKRYSDFTINNIFLPLSSEFDEWGDTTLSSGESCNEQVLFEQINRFARHKVTITDRFHGTIFSLIASTPVVVLETIDHKVSEGANWFIESYPQYIRKVSTVESAYKEAEKLMKSELEPICGDYFYQTYYAPLVNDLKKL